MTGVPVRRGRVHRNERRPVTLPARWPPGGGPQRFHRTLPGYQPTPALRLDGLANRFGLAELWVKDESSRLGLPSFKILGGAWAVHRLVMGMAGRDPGAADFADLRAAAAGLGLTLCAATDGNHGRGVARMARLLDFAAVIYVPADMTQARLDAIRSEGAIVRAVAGDYDDAVAAAAAEAARRDWRVVADLAYDGYTDVPAWVMEGYDTIFAECDQQMPRPPTAVVVQAGVGGLAGAAFGHYLPRLTGTRFAVVEPLTAACLLASAVRGRPVTLESSTGSTMAGLNCGTPSLVAWPLVQAATDVFLAIDDDRAHAAMRLLADAGVAAGESGAAGLGALVEALEWPEAVDALRLGPDARVLLVNTEGPTDPDRYRAVVGHRPA